MNKFPTPEEIEAERTKEVEPYVTATLAKIRAELVRQGDRANVQVAYPPPGAREEIVRVLDEAGWSAKLESEQREGTWFSVTRKAK